MSTPEKLSNLKLNTLRRSPSLAHLDEDALREFADLAAGRSFKRGEFIFFNDDPSNCFHVVQQGRVKLFRESATGKSFTLSVAGEGDTLHAVVLFSERPWWVSAQAMDDVSILCVEREAYISFVTRHPSVLLKIIDILGEQAHSFHERLIDFVGTNAKQRLMNILNMLCTRFGTTLLFTSEELGDLAGTTTETTIRMMGQLKKAGIISSSRGKIIILDKERLQMLSWGPY